jgi:hypothetical protein
MIESAKMSITASSEELIEPSKTFHIQITSAIPEGLSITPGFGKLYFILTNDQVKRQNILGLMYLPGLP